MDRRTAACLHRCAGGGRLRRGRGQGSGHVGAQLQVGKDAEDVRRIAMLEEEFRAGQAEKAAASRAKSDDAADEEDA